MKIENICEELNKIEPIECDLILPDGSVIKTDDVYGAVANYILQYIIDHELWVTDQIVIISTNPDDKDCWSTQLLIAADDPLGGGFSNWMYDWYEGESKVKLIAFTSIDNVGDAIMTGEKVDYNGKVEAIDL